MTTLSNPDAKLTEAEKKAKWIKTARRIYWRLTILFAGTMLMAGITFLMGFSGNVDNIKHLGYPLYVLKTLGVVKLLGAIVILWGVSQYLKTGLILGMRLY